MDYRMVSVCQKKIHFPRFFETVAAAIAAAPGAVVHVDPKAIVVLKVLVQITFTQ